MRKQNTRKPFQPRKKRAEHLLNREIQHAMVRITGDAIGESRVVPLQEAQRIADEKDMDLIEVTASAIPPVCRIGEYSKFLYDLKKRRKQQEKSNSKNEVKEMRLTYVTDEHDIDFKVKHAISWLKGGDKVRCVIRFKGRSIIYRDQGEVLLLRVSQMLEDAGKVESFPKLEGKNMNMVIAPKKTKNVK